MPSIQIPHIPGVPLSQSLKDLPPGFAEAVRAGFKVASRIPETQTSQVVELARAALDEPSPPTEQVQTQLGLSQEEMGFLTASMSVLIAAVTAETNRTSSEIVRELSDAGFIEESAVPGALRIASALAETRGALTKSIRAAQLASATLPALTDFRSSVDIRIRVEEGRVTDAIPVVLVHLDTDMSEEIWFQMSKRRLQRLIKQLQTVLERVEAAEQWSSRNK